MSIVSNIERIWRGITELTLKVDELTRQNKYAACEVMRLNQVIESLKPEAYRYKWLRDSKNAEAVEFIEQYDDLILDQAIDVELKKKGVL